MRFSRRLIACWLACAAGPAACADVPLSRFLVPASHQAAVGERVALRVQTPGADGALAAAAWPGAEVKWFFVRVAGTQQNFDTLAADAPGGETVGLAVERAGVTMIGLDLRPRVETLTGAEFEAFLAAKVAAEALPAGRARAAPDAPVRVRRSESMKSLMRVRNERGDAPPAQVAQSKAGQAAELRLMLDPTVGRVGSDVAVRAYVAGDKRPAARVFVQREGDAKGTEFVTDPTGSGHFRVTEAGRWRVEFSHAAPLKDDPEAEWAIHTATLTFEVLP